MLYFRLLGLKYKKPVDLSHKEDEINFLLKNAFATTKKYTYKLECPFINWTVWTNLRKRYFEYFFNRTDEASMFVFSILWYYDDLFASELSQNKKALKWVGEQIAELERYAELVRNGTDFDTAEGIVHLRKKSSNPEVRSHVLLLCSELVKHKKLLDLGKQAALSELANRESPEVSLAALTLLYALQEISQPVQQSENQ